MKAQLEFTMLKIPCSYIPQAYHTYEIRHQVGNNCFCIAGSYMYIESSAPRKEGDYANLFSETYEINKTPLTDEYCLVFWYHMYGTGMGKHTSLI